MFTVINGSAQGELKKEFDNSIKGNAYYLEGHKIIMPPSTSQGDTKAGH